MLNFENLDGFVVDLSTPELVDIELERFIPNKDDREYLKKQTDTQGLRDFIVNCLLMTYRDNYIFLREQNVYQIVECELKVDYDE